MATLLIFLNNNNNNIYLYRTNSTIQFIYTAQIQL